MKFYRNKKNFITLVTTFLIAALTPRLTNAADFTSITSSVIYWTLFSLNYAISYIAGLFFLFGSKLVEWTLLLNSNVIGQPVVLAGWSIALNLANLGFVLAIIVIAFATIFRLESYSIKQTLWKLIVAALLVNFSLVIAGGFISISDLITKYFQDASKLGPTTASQTLPGLFQIHRLTMVDRENMCYWLETGAFIDSTAGPCRLDEKGNTRRMSTWRAGLFTEFTCTCDVKAKATNASQKGGEDPLKEAASLLFTIVFTFLGVLTLITLAIMLLFRYVALGFLLSLAPLALVCWILPSTQHLWKKWWDNFLRWTFFAPAMSFFLYLATQSITVIKKMNTDNSASNALDMALSQAGFLETMGNMIILIGFMLGGLYVANSLGIMGASVAMNLAQKAGKGAGAWAGRKGLSGARRAGSGVFGNERMKNFGTKLQTMGSKPGFWGKAASLAGANKLGNAINKVGIQQGEAAVKDAEKKYGHLSDVELGKRMHQFNSAERQYAMQRMAKNDTLGFVAGGVNQYVTDKEKNTWARYGQGKQWGDLTKSAGFDENVTAAAKNINEASVKSAHANLRTAETKLAGAKSGFEKMDATAELMKAQRVFEESSGKELQEAISKFESGLSASDRNKMSANIISKYDSEKNNLGWSEETHNAVRLIKQKEMIIQAPETISKMRSKLKGESLIDFNANVEQFVGNIEEQLSNVIGSIEVKGKPTSWGDASSRDKINYLSKSKDDKIINKLTGLLKIERGEKGAMERAVHTLDRLYNSKKHFGGFFEFGSSGGQSVKE